MQFYIVNASSHKIPHPCFLVMYMNADFLCYRHLCFKWPAGGAIFIQATCS